MTNYFRSVWLNSHMYVSQLLKKKQTLVILGPFSWLALFFFVPFLLILKISFAKTTIGIPPFTAVFEWLADSFIRVQITFSNYLLLLQDDLYISTFASSVWVAGLSALVCLILGFMMAYGISRTSPRLRPIFLMLVVLPFWTSFLIRVYAWMSLLSAKGVINLLLLKIGFIDQPLMLLDNRYAVCVGIVYCYLPFMILPIYASLEKMDQSLTEAAFDLGATPWRTFWRVTVPLAFSGIIAGFTLVFVPAVGEFVIPELLGGPDTLMIGRALWVEFFNNRDWPQACSLAVSMIVVFVAPLMYFQRKQENHGE